MRNNNFVLNPLSSGQSNPPLALRVGASGNRTIIALFKCGATLLQGVQWPLGSNSRAFRRILQVFQ
jgi:hypothetical protein